MNKPINKKLYRIYWNENHANYHDDLPTYVWIPIKNVEHLPLPEQMDYFSKRWKNFVVHWEKVERTDSEQDLINKQENEIVNELIDDQD
jgi:hypothetical protein